MKNGSYKTAFIQAQLTTVMLLLTQACTQPKTEERKQTLRGSVASVYQVTGDVRVKSRVSPIWRDAIEGKQLLPGDLVFAGKNGKARLEYQKVGASLYLSSYSIIRITEAPPSFSKFRRRFGVEKSEQKDSTKKSSEPGKPNNEMSAAKNSKPNTERTIAMPGEKNATTDISNLRTMDATQGISISRDIESLKILYPKAKTILSSENFPATISAQIEESMRDTIVLGILWNVKDPRVPVWSSYQKGGVQNIPIPAPGNYTLQVLTEDEFAASEAIHIEAQKREKGGANFQTNYFFNDKKNSDITVIFQ